MIDSPYQTCTIQPLPLLQQLNDWVIRQNEKRLPKWKFRFAPDFAIQIHPRVTRAHDMLFECVALQTENLTVDLFTVPRTLTRRSYYRVRFDLQVKEDLWSFRPRGGRWTRDNSRQGYRAAGQRAIEVLKPERFANLNPEMMLSPHCLCCGKGLTDPASVARWVGPECFGSASTNLPRIFQAVAA